MPLQGERFPAMWACLRYRNLDKGYFPKCCYDPDHRVLRFPNDHYGSGPGSERFDIVHEATHALFDCFYGKPAGTLILAVEDEAATFLAEAIYSLLPGKVNFWSGTLIPGDPIDEALKVAEKIMAIPGAFNSGSPPYHVPSADLISLRSSIQTAYKLLGGAAGIQHLYRSIGCPIDAWTGSKHLDRVIGTHLADLTHPEAIPPPIAAASPMVIRPKR